MLTVVFCLKAQIQTALSNDIKLAKDTVLLTVNLFTSNTIPSVQKVITIKIVITF